MKDFTSKNYLLIIKGRLIYRILNGGFVGSVTVTPLFAITQKDVIAKMKDDKIALTRIIS